MPGSGRIILRGKSSTPLGSIIDVSRFQSFSSSLSIWTESVKPRSRQELLAEKFRRFAFQRIISRFANGKEWVQNANGKCSRLITYANLSAMRKTLRCLHLILFRAENSFRRKSRTQRQIRSSLVMQIELSTAPMERDSRCLV